jgi:hypothetical protein
MCAAGIQGWLVCLRSLCGEWSAVRVGQQHLTPFFGDGKSPAAVWGGPSLFRREQVLVDAQNRGYQNPNQGQGNKQRVQAFKVHGEGREERPLKRRNQLYRTTVTSDTVPKLYDFGAWGPGGNVPAPGVIRSHQVSRLSSAAVRERSRRPTRCSRREPAPSRFCPR